MADPEIPQDLLAKLLRMTEAWTPVRNETIVDPRNEPPSQLSGLTADRVHAAISLAELGDTRDLFAIYRDVLIADTHLQTVIETRFLAVIGDDPSFQPANDKDPEDVKAAEAIKAAVDRLPDFLGVCNDLLWGTLWPLSVVERTYRPAPELGLRYDWAEMIPVPDTLFRWTNGVLEIELADPQSKLLTGEWIRPEPNRYLIHRGHMLRLPDSWGGPMRALTWWFFLKVMDREWWVRFLDKFGTPFIVGKFDKQDDRSRQILERAFRLSTKIGGLVINKETQVELLKVGTADSADAYSKFHSTCNQEISRRVLGQTLSTESQSTGLGSGTSNLHGEVRDDIRGWDARKLSQTLRQQLFKPWLRLNGFTGQPPIIVWGGEEPDDNAATATTLSGLKTAGLRVTKKAIPVLSKRIGLELERDESAPASPQPTLPLSSPPPSRFDPSAAVDSISREAAAALSQVFRGSMAPARDVILASDTPEAAQAALLSLFSDWTPTKAAEIVETALLAGAWNGQSA